MPLTATSVKLDVETLTRVRHIAEAMGRSSAWVMEEAISNM